MAGFGSSFGAGVITAPVLMTGLVSATLIAGSMSGTLAAVTASITNRDNTAGVGHGIVLIENNFDDSQECRSDANVANNAECTSIDSYDEKIDLAPDGTYTTRQLSFKQTKTGGLTSFSMIMGNCVPTQGADMCGSVAANAMNMFIDYSLDGTLWAPVDNDGVGNIEQPAATWATGSSILGSNEAGLIKTHLETVGNEVHFRFRLHAGSATTPGARISQDITWSVQAP